MAETAKSKAAEAATEKPKAEPKAKAEPKPKAEPKAKEPTLEEQQAAFTDEERAAELERVKASIAESLEAEKADHVEGERKARVKADTEMWKNRRAELRAEKGFGGSATRPSAPKPVDVPDSSEQERAAKEAALPPQDGRESVFDPAPGKTEADVLERLEARAKGEFGAEQPDEVAVSEGAA